MGRIVSDPKIRKALYLAVASVLGLLASYGIIAKEDVAIILDVVVKVGGALALVLAALNVEMPSFRSGPKGRHEDDGDPTNGTPGS